MKEVLSTISSKGQVTIPAEIRKHLGVGIRDKITFVLEQDGEVKLKAPTYRGVASLRGAAGSLGRPLPSREMREIAREEYIQASPAAKRR
jgi:antitoxin PrlF